MWGIWDVHDRRFVFGICKPTSEEAFARLKLEIGKRAYKWKYEVRKIPVGWRNRPNPRKSRGEYGRVF